MDSDGRESSLEEFSSPDASPAQNPIVASANQTSEMDMSNIFEDEDSDADVSMSADSEDEVDNPESPSIPTNSTLANGRPQTDAEAETEVDPLKGENIPDEVELEAESSKKRKLDDTYTSNYGSLGDHEEERKRQKPDNELPARLEAKPPKDMSLLPAEIWHHIFTFCSPKSLGSLLPVNKAFHAYLDPSISGQTPSPLSQSAVSLLSSDMIWKASRRLINVPSMPGMPAPLSGKSKLDMWKLACGSLCQFCHKKRQANSTFPNDQWHPGPGENGVLPIWSFGVRTCGSCLQKNTTKEIDLLLSSVIPSPLMTALPFVFITNELHMISPTTLQTGQQPPHIQISKYYSNEQIQDIKKEFEDVKALGTATAEEWLKGLDGRGKERRNDASRWERWEASGGLVRMQASEASTSTESKNDTNKPSQTNGTGSVTNGTINGYPIPNLQQLQQLAAALKAKQAQLATSTHNNFGKPPPRFESPAQNGISAFPQPQHGQPKHARTKEEVAELKASRRAEIERRCMELDPPIFAGVLSHMASFQAAMQIIQPLTDSAWDVLKPRLLSQRGEAEQRENDRLAQTRVVQERFEQMRYQDVQLKSDPKSMDDSQWEDFQAPLRARIGGYADEIIRDGWNGGEKVNYDNSPLFAAEVLIYIRKRFYAEVAKDEAAVRATGREPEMDPPEGPYTRKLVLENMKWVFDTKVKPLTEPFRKELFVCNACGFASKYYGFEGVIQHYAAKHTDALSVGSVVVHWKSEWPEPPPFNPDPSSVPLNAFYPAAPGTTPYSAPGSAPQQSYGYGGYQQPTTAPIPAPPSQGYQTPAPFYGQPQAGESYSGHQNGPFAPPPMSNYPDQSQGYKAAQYSTAPPPPGASAYNNPPQDHSQQGYGGHYQAPAPGMYPTPHQGNAYLASVPVPGPQQAPYAPPGAQYGSYNQAQPYPTNNYVPPPKTEQYTSQLQNVARKAREIWMSIGNLKEVPGSLKVYTVIHHVLVNFHAAYNDTPPLSMIVDGLSNNKDMRPVRNVNGLVCKACSQGMLGSNSNPQRKHMSFPQLVNHFYSEHEQGIPPNAFGHIPNWTQDMVELPDMAKLASVVNAPGMDEKKLALFTAALPELAQPSRPSREEYLGNSQPQFSACPPNDYQQLPPSQDNHQKYYTNTGNGDQTHESGEYDPSHPEVLPAAPGPYSAQIKFFKEYPREEPFISRQSRHADGSQNLYFEPSHPYVEQGPTSSHAPPAANYERVRAEPSYVDRPVRYYEPEEVEYRARREPAVYDDRGAPPREYRASNTQAYQSNQEQSRVLDVVAQISQQAQKAQARQPMKNEPVDGGSEDGEVRPGTAPRPLRRNPPVEERSAAEHFLDNFRPGEPYESAAPKVEPEYRRDGPPERSRYIYDAPEPSRRPQYEDEVQVVSGARRAVRQADDREGYVIQERGPPRSLRAYPEETLQREPSPEVVDRRYKPSVIYQEERQGSQGTYRTPSRYARYESARLENDRARSRSPVHVKAGVPPPAHYQDAPPQPIYRPRSPQGYADEAVYERPPPPRQEYHPQRVYIDEPPRPRYEEAPAYELVRVSDPNGDYMIRRPVQRREPVYYEDEMQYAPPLRLPVYESRGPPLRAEGGQIFEDEYDPRHPEGAAARQGPGPVRYQ